MEFKYNVNDTVKVLYGGDIEDYALGWCSDMDNYVGGTFRVSGQVEINGRPAYRLSELALDAFDCAYVCYTFDERGLEPCEATWLSHEYVLIHSNGQSCRMRAHMYHASKPDPRFTEVLPDESSQIMPEEWFISERSGRHYVRVSSIDNSDKYYICPDCLQVHLKDRGVVRWDGRLICENCRRNYTLCADCGTYHPDRSMGRVAVDSAGNLKLVCDTCAFRYRRCDDCGRFFPIAHEFTSICGHDVCQSCASQYRPCPRCGVLTRRLRMDERTGEECCDNCYVEPEKFINSYHHQSRRSLKKYGTGPCYIGTELEVEKEDSEWWDRNDMAGEVVGMLNNQAHCERDGSLCDGFEIISEPHTPEEYFKLKWEEVLEHLRSNGYTSHNNGRCGLHIHFSNEWFGDDWDEIDDNVSKVIHLYSKEYDFFLKCSRRSARQADEWASRYVCDDFGEAKRKKSGSRGHHVAVNLANMNDFGTVEFRLGRGTLMWSSFRAWIDIHLAIVKNSRVVPKDNTDLNLWLKGISEETKGYIRDRTGMEIESEVI